MRMTRGIGTTLLAVLLALGACKKEEAKPAAKKDDKAKTPPKPEPKPEPPKTATGDDLAKAYQACWDLYNARKYDEFANCYADDVTSTQVGMPPVTGKAQVLEGHKAWAAAFPDSTAEPQLVFVSGRDVFSVRLFRGTHTAPLKGPMGEMAATNKKVGMLVMHHVQMNDKNQVAQEWWVFDMPTMMFQLGLNPSPARGVIEAGWPGAPIMAVAKDDDAERKNAEMVKKAYELWNKRDKAFDDLLADDIVESNASEPADSVGKKALQEHNAGFIAAFSDIRVEVETVWAAGEYTIEAAHIKGTNDGDMGPMKKTGKPIDVTILELMKWKDGKVVNSWVFMNGMQLAMQLGLMDEPKAPEAPKKDK